MTSIATYTTFYNIPSEDRIIHATSRIAFSPQEALAAQMAAAGLRVDIWMGEWDGRSFTPDAPEIIPLGGWNTRPA